MPLPRKISTNRGLIKAIIVIVIALLIISALGYNLRDLASQPNTKDNFGFAWEWVLKVWGYIRGPIQYFWNEVVLKTIIKPSVGAHNREIQSAIDQTI